MPIPRRTRFIALLPCWFLLTLAHPAVTKPCQIQWKPAAAPMVTRWTKDVRPDRVRSEYPRPLAQRKEWLSLNGIWDFDFDPSRLGHGEEWAKDPPLSRRILVPFTFETPLSGIGIGDVVHERIRYRRTFRVPRSWRGRSIRINFNACDWQTTVWVNGTRVGEHRGGYTGFSFDISKALLRDLSVEQEVVVAVYDPANVDRDGYQLRGKQMGSGGVWHTRTTGIWQTVWLEPVSEAAPAIAAIETRVDLVSRQGSVAVKIDTEINDVRVAIDVYRNGRLVSSESGEGPDELLHQRGFFRTQVVCSVADCELWSPESPALYDLKIRVYRESRLIDQLKSYCAFREYGVKAGRLTLNGKPYLLRGVLDQGYWPDGGMTPPTDAAIRYDVEMTKKLGFNLARKHMKVEDRRWYYWCDQLGLAVWQDIPASHNLAIPAARGNFYLEWSNILLATGKYPCVLEWILFNENWGAPGPKFLDDLTSLTRNLGGPRRVSDPSNWMHRAFTDAINIQDYGNGLSHEKPHEATGPRIVGAYGGISFPVEGRLWTENWSNRTARDAESYLRRARFQTSQLYEASNLSAFVYTQLTDVEQEVNGLLTYDRTPKADVRRLRAIFTGTDRASISENGFIRNWLVLEPLPSTAILSSGEGTGVNQGVMRQILAEAPSFDESRLRPNPGEVVFERGMAYRWRIVSETADTLDFRRIFRSEHRNQVTYAVAKFDLPEAHKKAALLLGTNDGARVWLNGREIWATDELRPLIRDQDLIEGLTLKAGRNVLVIKVADGFDAWGLAARFELQDGSILLMPGPKVQGN